MTSGEVGGQPHAVTGYVETAEVPWRLGRSRVPVVTALSLYLFLVLREGELALYRGSVDSLEPILLSRLSGNTPRTSLARCPA